MITSTVIFKHLAGCAGFNHNFFAYRCPYWRDNGPVVKLKVDETKEAENEQTTD